MFFKKQYVCLRLLHPVHAFPKKSDLRRISSKVLSSEKCEDTTQGWECAVGLEVHAQINAKSKLFSRSAAVFGAVTNSSVSYFDAAYPGTLPVLNKFCVEAGILTALALNCTINKISTFDRKHYFYPDLPAGYQITQHFHPLACNGHIKFIVHDRLKGVKPYQCCTGLQQLQLEQDSGKSFHLKGEKSYVDLNRAGIGLMELVFSPTLRNGLEAAALVKELILILRRLGTCTCELEEGTLRVDANISVNRVGEPLGVKTEVKNINSVRFISRAIDYEIKRQIEVLENGGFVTNETRAYDYDAKKTIYMRDKGTFQDYRFMPEPNLPPIKICNDSECVSTTEDESGVIYVNELKKKLPVLPDAERYNLTERYNLPLDVIDKLVSNEGAQEIFEICASGHAECDHMTICDFLFSNVQHQFNLRKLSFKDCPVTGSQIAEILELLISSTISEATANDILDMLFNGDQRSAKQIVNEYNWFLIRDLEELKLLCLQVIAAHKKVVQKYKKSKKKRHMAILIAALNENVNNRASYKEAAAMFHYLICEEEMDVQKIQEDNKD